ncbi:hypothetical protein [Pseudomonas sp. UMAB-40]|uniref:hypothetical protein n=1 Tax=Pseudomonas sp. UMAB-40 TaxID=1365407 RepID=UPI001C573A3C|nr:hypothetical protein [Pseudomonas sp. UMAB-40]
MTDKKNGQIDLTLGTPITSDNKSFEINPKFDAISMNIKSGTIVLTAASPESAATKIDNAITAIDAAIASIGGIRASLGDSESRYRPFNLSDENGVNHIISQKNSTYSHRFPEGSTLEDDKIYAIDILIELKNGIYQDGEGKPCLYKDFLRDLDNISKNNKNDN